MLFPIVIIKKGDPSIYFFNKIDFGLISKGGEGFYNDGIIYDSTGRKFLLNGMKSIKKAPLINSIKYFQQMYLVDVNCVPQGEILLPEFKEFIGVHIKTYKKYWIKKDLLDNLIISVMLKTNFKEIFKMFK